MLEPTYLRYVYDGLLKGSFSSNNASALPHGFIGLFEEEFFPASMSSNARNKLLKRLKLWALFKGSVCTEMASNILAEDINVSKTLIDRYSKLFNTPEPSKYILLARFYEYVTSETKRDEQKLDLIAQVIDIDEWRNINESVRFQTSPLSL